MKTHPSPIGAATDAAATTLRRPSHRTSRAELTIASWWRELRAPREAATRGRYSVAKARRFIAYRNTSSRLRQVAVLCLTPVPGLLISLALALIPLRDPNRGVTANWPYFVHVFVATWVVATSNMFQVRAMSNIDHREYGTVPIVVVAVFVAFVVAGSMVMLSVAWRFPIPFSCAILPLPLVISLLLAHAVGFRQLSRAARTKLLVYMPSLTVQASQLTIYPAYSALFTAANEWQRLLVVLFPGLKYAFKRVIFALSWHLGDFAREVAGTGVEISASMY